MIKGILLAVGHRRMVAQLRRRPEDMLRIPVWTACCPDGGRSGRRPGRHLWRTSSYWHACLSVVESQARHLDPVWWVAWCRRRELTDARGSVTHDSGTIVRRVQMFCSVTGKTVLSGALRTMTNLVYILKRGYKKSQLYKSKKILKISIVKRQINYLQWNGHGQS